VIPDEVIIGIAAVVWVACLAGFLGIWDPFKRRRP